MDHELLSTFVSLAKTKSFTKTAEDVFCTQSTVSLRIQSLEAIYGVKLFHRIGKSVSLTEAGTLLMPHAELILAAFREAGERIDQLKNLASGKIDLLSSHTPGTYLLPPVIAVFRKAYPAVGINSHVHYAKEVLREIAEGHRFDFGLVSQPEPMEDERIDCRFVMDDELSLVVWPDHPWAGRKTIDPNSLSKETFLLSNGLSSLSAYLSAAIGGGFKLNDVIVAGNAEAVKRSVKMKLGVSILSRFAVDDEVRKKELAEISLDGITLRRSIFLINRRNRIPSPASEAFLSMLFERCGRKDGPLNPAK